jgi:hypothetical protein
MLIAIGAIGFVFSVDATDVNLDCIISNPDKWMGKKVNVEGVVGSTADDTFTIWNTCLDSSLTVKYQGEPPAHESSRVMVTGEVTTIKDSGAEHPIILVEEWNYLEH